MALCALFLIACSDKKRDAIGHTEVVMETSMGNITLRLYDDTPLHRDNFVRLARMGAYDGIVWNRIVDQSTIQSGDPNLRADGGKPAVDPSWAEKTIKAEIRYPAISTSLVHWLWPASLMISTLIGRAALRSSTSSPARSIL